MTETTLERIKTQAVGQHKAMLLDIPEVAEFATIAAVRRCVEIIMQWADEDGPLEYPSGCPDPLEDAAYQQDMTARNMVDTVLAEFPEARESA